MSMTQERAGLIAKLEDLSAVWVYNKSNNYGKGGFYHYPVTYRNPACNNDLFDGRDGYPIMPETVDSLRYEFGANKYFIGSALDSILDYLENRYNLDFDKLEEDYIKRLDDEIEEQLRRIGKT